MLRWRGASSPREQLQEPNSTAPLSEDKPGPVVAVDLDASNRVIGLEIIGVREFSIRWLRKAASFDLSGFDLEGAKFIHTRVGPRQPAAS